MGKTRKYVPDLRVRKPYRREPKMRTNVPAYEPFEPFDYTDDEVTEVDDEETENHGNCNSQG